MGRERRGRETGGGEREGARRGGESEWGKRGGEREEGKRVEGERMRRAEEGGDESWAGGWRRERERERERVEEEKKERGTSLGIEQGWQMKGGADLRSSAPC